MTSAIMLEIKARSRLSRGLLSILKDDIDMINMDADNHNIFTINESIKEARDTIAKINENFNELEYAIDQIKKKHH